MTTTPSLSLKDPATLLATWFGAGLLPKAPGTWGSLAALPFAWALTALGGRPLLAVAAVLLFPAGCWAAGQVGRILGRGDPGCVVVDEVVGLWIVLLAAPPGLLAWVIGFALFRLFDIVKPWPISWADREVKGGLGIMLDDVLAGLIGAAVMAILCQFWSLR
jgi:phosphatidylglycerophosphatase A